MLPDIPDNVAVIVVEPAATGVASPWLPVLLLIVAIELLDDFHVTEFVIF